MHLFKRLLEKLTCVNPQEAGAEWTRIIVKYANTCHACRREIFCGEQALWMRGSGKIKHVTCNANLPPEMQHQETGNLSSGSAAETTIPAASKYCPRCGSSLGDVAAPKFCPGCGQGISNPEATPITFEKSEDFEELEGGDGNGNGNGHQPSIPIEELGRRLEDMTAQILQSMGYSTQLRQVIKGTSGSRNEIDILARKGDRIVAVECKNYSKFVGADQLREFKSKLDDLQIKDALFVTNAIFSRDAELFANHQCIRLWDGRRLRESFFSMTIGRLGSVQEVFLKNSLPVRVTFEEASRLALANPSAIRLQRPKLIFHPYYRFDYSLDIARKDPVRKMHRVKDSGSIIVDAVDGEIITSDRVSGLLSRFTSPNLSSADDEAVASREERQTIQDILGIKPERDYRFVQGKEFDVVKLRYGVSFRAAKFPVVDKIVQVNTKEVTYHVRVSRDETRGRKMPIIPKPNEVYIKRISMIYVPMWSLEMEGNRISYSRRILASSGTVLVDNITYCPKHFTLGKMQFVKKQTGAVCEVCGGAFCKDHIVQEGGAYYCQEHAQDRQRAGDGRLGALKKGWGFLRK